MNSLKLLLLFSVGLVFSACSTVSHDIRIDKDKLSLATTTISNTWVRNGAFDWKRFEVIGINGNEVEYRSFRNKEESIRIKNGKINLLVFSNFNHSFGGICPCEVFLEVEFIAKEQHQYKLMGKIDGAHIKVWVIDLKTKERVSTIVEESYRRSADSIPIYIPIGK